MKKWFGLSIGFSFAATFLCFPSLGAQALGNWSSPRNDMSHDGWQKAETILSKERLSGQFKFLWKIKLGAPAKDTMSYSEPILVPRLINARGFKDFVLWAGTQDLFGVDSELGTMLWTKHFDAAPSSCGPSNLGVIAEAPLTINFRARRVPGAPPPPPPAGPMPVSQRRIGVSPGGGGFGIKGIYVLASDGYLHEQVIATGADFAPPVKFLPAAVGVSTGLGLDGKRIYTATKTGCSGGQNAVWTMEMDGKNYSISNYKMGTIPPLVAMGPTLDDDVAYVVTGAGKTDSSAGVYANSIVALGPDAKVKDWYEASGSLQNVTPVVFTYNQKKLLAAPGKDGSYVLLDTQSLGGADHHTPIASTPSISKAKTGSIAALASWRDTSGTWILASVPGAVNDAVKFEDSNGAAPHGSIVAFKVEEESGKTKLVPAWISRDLINPAPPVIANGLVIALSQGDTGRHATLYVLDATTGKELYSSKDTIDTYAHMAGVAVGDGHAFFVTHDNVLYSFGIGMEH